MIISHEHKFIFIKTAKTAGTSIEVFLSPHCGARDILTPIVPSVEGHRPRNYRGFINPFPAAFRHPRKFVPILLGGLRISDRFFNHMPATLIVKRVSARVWREYYKFCVERNPWDKVLSHYHMAAARREGSFSLDEYLARRRFPWNSYRYTDRTGAKIIVDRVVRFENLLADLGEVFAHIGIPFEGHLGVRAKSDYRSDPTPYRTVFNDAQRAIVAQAFEREIDLHGYAF
jgi:hypothetical protein